jgi:thiol:disulfide interchange protein DsbC
MLTTAQHFPLRATLLAVIVALSACSSNSQPVSSAVAASAQTANTVPADLAQKLGQNLIKAGLNAKVLDIQPTEVNGIFWVTMQGLPAVFTTADGQYILQGDLVKLGQNTVTDVTAPLVQAKASKLFSQIDPKDTVIYKPATTKAVAYVFTDVDCGYCRKLHSEMADITGKGIEIRYLAWPRSPQIAPKMQAIWCSEDRNAAMDAAKNGLPVTAPSCKDPVESQHQLGLQLGVNGTPAIYSADGKYLGGYIPAAELVKMLGVQ